tara:strand:- start:695 stop:913 length:219 start_codon:yes stop_codon:yes gene_type:complete
MLNEITGILIIVGISIFIFLLCREIVCWYWKINKRNELLVEQNQILKSQNDILKNIHNEIKKENTIANTVQN